MNSFGQRPPIYLVVDVAGPESEHRKLRLVNDILDELSAEAHANGIGSDDHVTVVLFAEAAEVAVSAAPLYGASLRAPWQIPLSIRRSRLSRSYIAVFDLLRREIGRTHGGTQDTVVVMVTDGTDPENWEPALDDLVSEFPGLTLLPITHGAPASGTASRLARPGGEVGGIVVREPSKLASKVVEGVVTWAQELKRRSRSAPRSMIRNDDLAAVGAPAGAHGRSATCGLEEIPFHSPPVRPVESEPPAAASAATTELPVAAPTMVLPPSSSTPTPTPVTENGQDDAAAEWKGSLQSFVVGDPGNASKVRALPDATEWNHRDTVLDGVTLMDADDRPVVELRAASVRGLAHRYNGTVRQDDYAYRCTDDGRFLVCAVSDGVSSARLSHKAAALVTRQGCEILANELREQAPEEIDWARVLNGVGAVILDFGARLLQKSRQPGEPEEVTPEEVARQMAATAVFAIVDLRPDSNDRPVHVCTVGDSSALILRDGRTWQSRRAARATAAPSPPRGPPRFRWCPASFHSRPAPCSVGTTCWCSSRTGSEIRSATPRVRSAGSWRPSGRGRRWPSSSRPRSTSPGAATTTTAPHSRRPDRSR